MDHDDGLTRAFVEVVQADAITVEDVTDEGIMFAAEVHHSTPIIKHVNPLPMPRNAMR